MLKKYYLNSNKSIISLIATSMLSLFIYFYNNSTAIQSIQGFWTDVKSSIIKPKSDLDYVIKYRDKWTPVILSSIQSDLTSFKNHNPRGNELKLLIKNKLDFIRIKDREIDGSEIEFVAGTIFSHPTSQISNTVLVNIGRDDFKFSSQNRNFIVVDSQANLVGKIVNLGENSSTIRLINDANNKVIVEDQNNTLSLVLMLPISHNKGELWIKGEDIISIGDTLYTSTKSDVYIDRIPVCRVINVLDKKDIEPFRKVFVEFLTDLSNLSFVVVIASEKKGDQD